MARDILTGEAITVGIVDLLETTQGHLSICDDVSVMTKFSVDDVSNHFL